jgi:hypothetical protein
LNIIESAGEPKNSMSNWGIYFAAPSNQLRWCPIPIRPDYPEEDLTVPRLAFNTRHWRPDEELLKLLRGIGRYGNRLDEKHLDLWELVDKPRQLEIMEAWLAEQATLQA